MGRTVRDIFKPTQEPARSIYEAFQKEAEKRAGKTIEEWTQNERNAVLKAANKYAKEKGLAEITEADVAREEIYALGHTDYGAKWAYGVTKKLKA